RGFHVTGVQTCALPILECPQDDLVDPIYLLKRGPYLELSNGNATLYYSYAMNPNPPKSGTPIGAIPGVLPGIVVERFNPGIRMRSEERRVGKDCETRSE